MNDNDRAILAGSVVFHGLSPAEVRQFLTLTGEVAPTIADYQFTNVVNLMRDFRKGLFRAAWEARS